MRKLAILALLLSCSSAKETAKPEAAPSTVAAAPPKSGPPAGIDLSIIDPGVKPCDDFYRFACGKWLDRTPIPEDRPLWGRAFSEIAERNQALLKEIVEKDARGAGDPSDPFASKVGAFYATCMDEQKAETASLLTLQKELAA